MSQTVDIMDDVTAMLNGGTFSISFTAERVLFREAKPEDYEGLSVLVLAAGLSSDIRDRTHDNETTTIGVQILKLVKASDDAEMTALIGLVEEIARFLNAPDNEVLDGTGAQRTPQRASVDPLFDHDQLEENGLFMSTILVGYDLGVER
jgi:hypothetical protein